MGKGVEIQFGVGVGLGVAVGAGVAVAMLASSVFLTEISTHN